MKLPTRTEAGAALRSAMTRTKDALQDFAPSVDGDDYAVIAGLYEALDWAITVAEERAEEEE